jgi:hypothetical protein
MTLCFRRWVNSFELAVHDGLTHQNEDTDDQQDHTEDERSDASHAEPEDGLAETLPQSLLGAVADDETMPLFA